MIKKLEKIVDNSGNILLAAGTMGMTYNLALHFGYNYPTCFSHASAELSNAIIGLAMASAGAFIQSSILNPSFRKNYL